MLRQQANEGSGECSEIQVRREDRCNSKVGKDDGQRAEQQRCKTHDHKLAAEERIRRRRYKIKQRRLVIFVRQLFDRHIALIGPDRNQLDVPVRRLNHRQPACLHKLAGVVPVRRLIGVLPRRHARAEQAADDEIHNDDDRKRPVT